MLQNPNFRLLWLAQAITTFGSSFTRVAIPIYVFQLTGSYAQLGLAFFASLLPSLLFGLFAGALVDRWDRRRTMIWTDLLNFVLLSVLIGIITLELSSSVKLGALFTIVFLTATLREIFNPARIAIFADVVPESDLLTANSLDQSTMIFGDLLSYPAAALALAALGPQVAFGVDAVTFVVSAVLIWGVKVHYTPPANSATSNIWKEIGEGLAVANKLPLVRKIVILSFIVPITLSLLHTLQLPYAVDLLGSTEEIGYPALEGGMALGLVIGTLLLGRFGQHIPRWKQLALGLISYGAMSGLIGLIPQMGAYLSLPVHTASGSPWTPLLLLALPFVFLQGATNSLIFTSIRTVTQEQTPRALIGRVASLISVAGGTGFAVGALLTGFGENRVGEVFTGIGIVIFTIGVISLHWLRVPPAPHQPPEQPF